jgi:hypothetical protein
MTRNIFAGCSKRAAPVLSLLFETGGCTTLPLMNTSGFSV